MPPLLCVVHVPKTAGSAIRETLIAALGWDKIYWISHQRPRDDWDRALGTEFEQYAVVGGHVPPYEFDKISRPKIFLAIVRDPVQRAISLFHYIVRGPDEAHPFRSAMQGLTIAEAIERSPEFRAEVQNFQCYLIGGETSFAAAVRSLSERDWFIDRHERIESLFARVCQRFDWPLKPLVHNNAGEQGYAAHYATKENVAAVEAVNGQDNMLYAMLAAASDATAAHEYWRSMLLDRETMKHIPQSADLPAALEAAAPGLIQTPTAVTPVFAAITAFYRTLLLREPDQAGLEAYLKQIRHGMPLEDLVRDLLHSAEFRAKFWDFVQAYRAGAHVVQSDSVAAHARSANSPVHSQHARTAEEMAVAVP